MRERKILLVTLDFWPKVGGVANYYFNLCQQLRGWAAVLTMDGLEQENIKAPKQKLNFKIIKKKILVNYLWPHWLPMFWHIWRAVRREKIEILWVGEVLPTGTAAYVLSKFLKLPYIVSCHGNDILQAREVKHKEKLMRKILDGAELVTANSAYTGELVKNMGIKGDKIKVVYPGIDPKSKIQDLRIREELVKKYNLEGKRVILSVGRLVARKGFDKVIEAMPQVVRAVPGAVYLIAGDGPEMLKLKHLSIKASKHVKLLGKTSEEEKWALLGLCDVFVMPAKETKGDIEGFGIVYLEAGLAGKPVVASKVGGVKEAVADGETGLLVKSENVEEISQAIIKLLSNEGLAEKLGQAGYQRAVKKFSWEKIGREFKSLIG